jgi:TIR domain-containing protein
LQLFDALTQYGYRVFLDTVSVAAGADFQQALWGRMADVDLLVFLDTKTALSSRWVHEELARAHDLGLGTLQLIWPDHTRTPGTELSDFIQLMGQDFRNGSADAADLLKDDVLKKVLAEAERSRIRSLKARHDRVLTDLVEQAHEHKLQAVIHPVEVVTHPVVSIELRRDDQRLAIVIPLVGIPDAVTIQQLENIFAPTHHAISKIVYDGLGLPLDWADHLDWLNRHHRLQTNQVATLDTWLGDL